MPFLSRLGRLWAARPREYSRLVWSLILCLCRLPWPWGEEILAVCFVARAPLRTTRLLQALAWASAQPTRGTNRWRLARRLCACHGRFVARSALIGIREPALLRQHTTVRGADRLAAGRGAILIGFHLGPLGAYLALRVAGHRVVWLGGPGAAPLWSRAIQEQYGNPSDDLFFSTSQHGGVRMGLLYRARQIVRDGGTVFLSADGLGREAFSVPVRSGRVVVRGGWLALRRATNVPVFPVLSHLQGRTQVVTVHPALPPLDDDPSVDLERCRRALAELLNEYARQFPEQCYSLAFPWPTRSPIATMRRGGFVTTSATPAGG